MKHVNHDKEYYQILSWIAIIASFGGFIFMIIHALFIG